MTTGKDIKVLTPFTMLLLLCIAGGLAAVIYRMSAGLGAATNLSDEMPWGLWIGFDLLGGVAMAAGGFLIAGAVYLFNMEKYRPIVRPAVLTAFIGYLLAVIALFFDLGHPFRIWHPAFMWQYHSVLWVVAMHVMFYTMTLAVEFSPMLFEKMKAHGLLKFVNGIMVGVVLFGVMLSVLHQSSLGALYLIMIDKMSGLWYNSLLPYFFLVSAVAMGLNMVSLESIISARAFGHKPPLAILQGLARGSIWALGLYLLMKIAYLVTGQGGVAAAFTGSMEANIYLVELAGGVLVPLILLLNPSTGDNVDSILWVNILVVAGVLLNRMSIAVFSVYGDVKAMGGSYFPSLLELLLTLGIVALGILLFKLVAKYLPLFPGAEPEY